MWEILKNILVGAAGSALYACFSERVDYWLIYRKSDFTGFWKNSVLDKNGQILKVDYCHLLHNPKSGVIKGRIIRNHPETQNDRRWNCNGVLKDQKIIMTFWSTNGTTRSDGSGYLFLVADRTFKGVYMHGTPNNTIENVDVMSEKIKDPDEIKRIKILMK